MSVKLTQFAHGAGCGCKIAPSVLQQILKSDMNFKKYSDLLVGYESSDDAAIYNIGMGLGLISTTDFFTPIVDDAFDFGRIAAANAISDVYAMGGKPIMALSILGFPIDKLPLEIAGKMLDGARAICEEAGISLAGGHSIDIPEPVFGLSVSGLVPFNQIKKNNTANEGDFIFLTKPVGTGILATAGKRGVLLPEHEKQLVAQMATLNRVGEELGKIEGVSAMTDVTGFGLAGHLIEMAEGSGLSAEIWYDKIKLMDGVKSYLSQKMIPDATYRNWNSYGKKINFDNGVDVMEAFSVLPDPQTNGGLLISVTQDSLEQVITILEKSGLSLFNDPIGKFVPIQQHSIFVQS